MRIAHAFDALIQPHPQPQPGSRFIDTAQGRIRLRDSGGDGPVLLLAPDGPCVVEHYAPLFEALAGQARVIAVDLPGFGYSRPARSYTHGFDDGAAAILAVIEALALRQVVLSLSCVNGYYGIVAAARSPHIRHLVLAQTPSLAAMRTWTDAIVPRPIRMPIVGQLLNRCTRARVARGWYRVALADRAQRAAFTDTAIDALHHGACYCFAGVVQGVSAAARHSALPSCTVPSTVVWGDADRSHRHTDPHSIHAHLPQARIEHYPDCGHFPDLEQAARYAALVRNILGSV